MAKWFGYVGYAIPEEIRPGVWKDRIVKRQYSGDVEKSTSRWSSSNEGTNDNLTLDKQISIVVDPFAHHNYSSIKFIEFMGVAWKVVSVNPQYPRLILTIGGVYNGQQT
jgi:hypothetical protein